ncbi:MAG TPA: hypothetical protein VMF58_06010 [Rhizomicrobium sp.]|nr:hypothetical protein [Rhizomicrobium sp.]
MGRLVTAVPAPGAISLASSPPGDDYATRVAKYIPGEIVAAYVAIQNIWTMNAACVPGTTEWLIYAAFVVLTGLYLYSRRTPGDPYIAQVAIGMVAFVIWSYALTACPKFGVFAPYFSEKAAGVLLILFSLAAGLYQPTKP